MEQTPLDLVERPYLLLSAEWDKWGPRENKDLRSKEIYYLILLQN
jgi:hypothetical protein